MVHIFQDAPKRNEEKECQAMNVLCLGGAGKICREAAYDLVEFSDDPSEVFKELKKRQIFIHEKINVL
jgi:hypothetical protein